MKKFFIVGGTSELGNRVIKGLIATQSPENITCLVRLSSDTSFLKTLGVNIIAGDVTVPETYFTYLDSSITYIDMTHPKHYHKSIDIIKSAGVQRSFFNTTTGIFSKYRKAAGIYIEGESRIKKSGICYTILRPSLIYGTDRDRNMVKLLKVLNKMPVFPVFGKGNGLMQPVFVQDLADGIVSAISNPELTREKEYNLCGPSAIPYIQILLLASKALGKKVSFVHIPHNLAVISAAVLENIPGFPITKEQVLRLLEDKQFDISAAVADLKYSPRDFSKGIKEEVSLLKLKGILH